MDSLKINSSPILSRASSPQPLKSMDAEINQLISSIAKAGYNEKSHAPLIKANVGNAIAIYKATGNAKEKFSLQLPNGTEQLFQIIIGKNDRVVVRSLYAATESPDDVFFHPFASTIAALDKIPEDRSYEEIKYPSEKLVQILKNRIPLCDRVLPIPLLPTLAENSDLLFVQCALKNGLSLTCKLAAAIEGNETIINIFVLPDNDEEYAQSFCQIATVKGISLAQLHSHMPSSFDDAPTAHLESDFSAREFVLGAGVTITSVDPQDGMKQLLRPSF